MGKKLTQGEVDKVLLDAGFVPEEGWAYEQTEHKIPGTWASCGHQGTPRYSNVSRRGSRCLKCGFKKTAEFLRLTHAEVLEGLTTAGFTPVSDWLYTGNAAKIPGVWDICGHSATPNYCNISAGARCRKCRKSGEKPGQNSVLETLAAVEFVPDSGWSYSGAFTKIPGVWTECGHPGTPQLANVVHKDSRCQICGRAARREGMPTDRPTYVYLLHNHELAAIKVGVAVVHGHRINAFKAQGWSVLKLVHFDNAFGAYELEDTLLSKISEKSLSGYLSATEMPIGGYTETFEEDALDFALELLHRESKQLIV